MASQIMSISFKASATILGASREIFLRVFGYSGAFWALTENLGVRTEDNAIKYRYAYWAVTAIAALAYFADYAKERHPNNEILCLFCAPTTCARKENSLTESLTSRAFA